MGDGKKKEMVECPHCLGKGKTFPQFQTIEEMVEFVMQGPNKHPWHAGWFYNQAGDMIEAYFKNCAMVTVQSGFTHPSGISLMREHFGNGEYGEIVGIQIHGVIGRLTLEAQKAAYIRPGPREPLKCPICEWKPKSDAGEIIYSAEPIICEKCGTEFGGPQKKE